MEQDGALAPWNKNAIERQAWTVQRDFLKDLLNRLRPTLTPTQIENLEEMIDACQAEIDVRNGKDVKMKNTHTIATLAVAAFASACVVGFQTPRQEPQPSQATIEGNEREAVREELRALSKIVLFYVGENDGKVPVFSSRMPPVWASTRAGLHALLGPGNKATESAALRAYKRTCEYKVPDGLVGKSLDSIGDHDLFIELSGQPSYVPYKGASTMGFLVKNQ